MNETLRINGHARITADAALRESLAVDGKLPVSVTVVSVKAAYMHCAKAFMRSELWKPESWLDRATLPTLGEILRDQLALAQSAEATDKWLDEGYQKTMW
jgi:predicted pyridoxine 5'-phosphate oxidase superfamily flavin-nucleotide-binding protein